MTRMQIKNKRTGKEKVIIFDRGRKQPVDHAKVILLIVLAVIAVAVFFNIANTV